MLVITRKPGERICLGDDVTVTVLEVVGSTVRLGIEAPAEIPIYRHEIWAAVKAENQAAAEASIRHLPKKSDSGTSPKEG
jgi:carbon storage regulator